MFRPIGLYIGLRYMRAKRRNHFISFISMISMLGVALGVTALITVLSVMNGFEKELRERILGMTAHITLVDLRGSLQDWRALSSAVERHKQVRGSAPFVRGEAMLTFLGNVHAGIVEGIAPEVESEVSEVGERMVEGSLARLKAGEFNVALGRGLARALGANIGDKVTLVAPQSTPTPAGIIPRLKQFTLVGVFEVGMHDYDNGLALLHIEDAAKLFRVRDGVTGLRVKVSDPAAAPQIGQDLERMLPNYAAQDWTERNVTFFRALKTEKTVMFVILTLIVAVAAFNIISTLVMVVTDKQAEIAILRTLGLSPRGVMAVFIVQGTLIGLIGTLLGLLGGTYLATHVGTIVPAIENLFQTQFLPSDIYYISRMPSELRWPDVWMISMVAFAMCMLGTLYPAFRASRTRPAEVLRHE
ncbi:MAG: lipoprotein-releasing ABC transporter permease subunit [Gammaproteobacteria bacterium]